MDSKTYKIVAQVLGLVETTQIDETDDIMTKRSKYLSGVRRSAMFIPDFNDVYEEIVELIDTDYLTGVTLPEVFEQDYQPWLNEVRDSIDFSFYDRYERYLILNKNWKKPAVASLNKSTDIILDHMRNPKSEKSFTNRGLVIGEIQSGKTANYTALINKALDVGFKLIIVLAGMTKDLRKQTQLRLDSEVLGYETREDSTHGAAKGVGSIAGTQKLLVDCLTYNDANGDFKGSGSTISFSSSSTPTLAVVKKQVNVLENLHKLLSNAPQQCYTNGKLNVPVLIVDDEVDQASPNTGKSDDVDQASKTNMWIRKIIAKCNRVAYVGYTATPFANIFINPFIDKDKIDDLFPKDYIICLESSDAYSGIDDFFSIDDSGTTEVCTDLCCEIDDFDDFFNVMPVKIRKDTQIDRIAGSLEKALKMFVIAASVKKARGIVGHNSMLVNISNVKWPSDTLVLLLKEKVEDLYYAYKYEEVSEQYRNIWESEFKNISEIRLKKDFHDEWKKIEVHISKTFSNLLNNGIKLLNGDSDDIIDYEATKSGDWLIVGGNKLSRGLTLEGLTVSYFYRSSKQYDTLLQMGRWFGYRTGWLDLCRVFAEQPVLQNFVDIGLVLHELRNDIADMNDDDENRTPLKFGLKIRTVPNMVPTAKNKMRVSKRMTINFADGVSQVLSFDPKNTEHNLNLTCEFIEKLGNGIVLQNNKVIFHDVSSNEVIDYLNQYRDASGQSGSVETGNWIQYVRKCNSNGEMKKWKVVLSTVQEENYESVCVGDYRIVKGRRSDREALPQTRPSVFKLRVNSNPSDFRDAFYDIEEMASVKTFKRNNPVIQKYFTKEQGVLSIQLLDICYKEKTEFKNKRQQYRPGKTIEDGKNVVALTVWFPKSEASVGGTDYIVNDVYLRQEEEDKL